MNKKRLLFTYIAFDILAAIASWVCLYVYRKVVGESMSFGAIGNAMMADPTFFWGLLLAPTFWVFLHAFFGYYNKVYRKSRLNELKTTIGVTIFGVLVFFFLFILDDIVTSPRDYIKYMFCYFTLQFLLTYIPRVCITTRINRRIHRGLIGFNTIIVGSDAKALQVYNSLQQKLPAPGNFLIGYVKVEENSEDLLGEHLTYLGTIAQLPDIVSQNHIEELIVTLHNGQRKHIDSLIVLARDHGNLSLRIAPQQQDVLLGTVKTSSVMYEPLIDITPEYLPTWQRILKRGFDIVFSLIALILLLPLYIFLAIGVKKSSPGPIFYRQERIGYHGKPFHIIKFRSMKDNAETSGPMLSSKSDDRITPFGKFMRQYRLDETPQFYNVLIGDMSLVGPRPERQYYIDQITERVPYYPLLLGIKPGITSWGQVKFGYAENVDEMIERLRWDILYIENMSIEMDIKILIYTVMIVLKKEGK
ncbi:MAG: sugar transferase [Bacteroidales bacterium]|nr:sugar transferase [Bacteroidales bacterium]MCR5549885.1 sugar transferase [Bacteroidales bacterium]